MAEIFESGGSGSNSVKKLFKNKKFLAACGVVAIVALIVFMRKQSTQRDEEADGSTITGIEAMGYITYPTAGGSGGDSDLDWYYNKIDSMQEDYDSKLADISSAYDEKLATAEKNYSDSLDAMQKKYEDLLNRTTPSESGSNYYYGTTSSTQKGFSIDEQAIIDAMEQNSNLWWDATDKAGRDSLHSQNQILGSMIGATYDGKSGTWQKDGQTLFNVTKGDPMQSVTGTGNRSANGGSTSYVNNIDYQAAINNAIKSGASASTINQLNDARNAKIQATGNKSANTSYDKNTDYQSLINQAKASGASQSVINNLQAQREAKIKGENLTQYQTTKKTTTKKTTGGGGVINRSTVK